MEWNRQTSNIRDDSDETKLKLIVRYKIHPFAERPHCIQRGGKLMIEINVKNSQKKVRLKNHHTSGE